MTKKLNSYLLNDKLFIDSIKSGLNPSQIHIILIKSGVLNPNTDRPYSIDTIRRLVKNIKGDVKKGVKYINVV